MTTSTSFMPPVLPIPDFSAIIDSITCPITQDVMVDPVLGNDGHTYEKTAIIRSLELKQESPLTRVRMTINDLQPNYGIKALCDQYHTGAFGNIRPMGIPAQISTDNILIDHTISKNENNKVMMTFNVDEMSLPPNLEYDCLPQDVFILIDRSGSMNFPVEAKDADGNKLENGLSIQDIVNHAANTVAKTLPKSSRLGVIIFDNKIELLFDLMCMTEVNKSVAITKISSIKPNGQTNIWGAIDQAVSLLYQRTDKSRNSHIILLTDGIPNNSPSRGEIETLKRLRKTTNFSSALYTFGFGYNLQPGLLYDLAKYANGCNAHIPDGNMIGSVFSHYIATILTTVVMNLQLHIQYTQEQNYALCPPLMGDFAYVVDENDNKHVIVDVGTVMMGQMKNIILNCDTSFTYYYTYKIGGKEYSVVSREALIDSLTIKDRLIDKEIARYKVVEMIREIINYKSIDDTDSAIKKYNELEQYYSANIFTDGLMTNIQSQIKIACMNPAYYNRWGKFYLDHFSQSLCKQITPNNKDIGCKFGGKVFDEMIEIASDVFDTLEAPEPSLLNVAPAPSQYRSIGLNGTYVAPTPAPAPMRTASLQQYNGGGCFDKMCDIAMADGSKKPLMNLVKGDRIRSIGIGIGDGYEIESTVVCILETHIRGGLMNMVNLPSGLKITPWHPIKMLSRWEFPGNCIQPRFQLCDAIITMVLSNNHIAIINDVPCITLGHNYVEGILEHPYYGTSKIVDDLKAMPGWANGHIMINDGCFMSENGRVSKIVHPDIGLDVQNNVVVPRFNRNIAFDSNEQTESPEEMPNC